MADGAEPQKSAGLICSVCSAEIDTEVEYIEGVHRITRLSRLTPLPPPMLLGLLASPPAFTTVLCFV